MPESLDSHIRSLQEKLHVLVKKYIRYKKENHLLAQKNEQLNTQNKELSGQNELLTQQVAVLKSSLGTLAADEKKMFEKTLNEYIRTVEKCISVLNK